MNELMKLVDIQRLLKCGRDKAKRIHAAAKSLDQDKFNLRPTEVPLDLVFEVLELSKRAQQRMIEKYESERSNYERS